MQIIHDLETGYWKDRLEWYNTLHEARKHRQIAGGLNRVAVEARQNSMLLLQQLKEQHHEATRVLARSNDLLAQGRDLQEETVGKLDQISTFTQEIASSLVELSATFDWQLDQVNEWLSVQSHHLESIVDLLRNPMETRAREAWAWAQRAMERGWIEDAVRYYNQALETSPFMYPAYLQLGHLHAYQRGDDESAIKAYMLAAKYAEPDDPSAASIAHYNLYALYYSRAERDNAWDSIVNATTLAPAMASAWWDRATLASELGKPDEMVGSLEQAIRLDPLFWHRARTENVWGSHRPTVRIVLARELRRGRQQFYGALREARQDVYSGQQVMQRIHSLKGWEDALIHDGDNVGHLIKIAKAIDLYNFAIMRDAPQLVWHETRAILSTIERRLNSLLQLQVKREQSVHLKYLEARNRFLDEASYATNIRGKWSYLPHAAATAIGAGLVVVAYLSSEDTRGGIALLAVIVLGLLLISYESEDRSASPKQNGFQRIHSLLSLPAQNESRLIDRNRKERMYVALRDSHKSELERKIALQQALVQINSMGQD